jgi:hypothetical protein
MKTTLTPTEAYLTRLGMFLKYDANESRMGASAVIAHLHLNNMRPPDGGDWVIAHSSTTNSIYRLWRELCRFHANNDRPREAAAVADSFTKDDGTYAYRTEEQAVA